MSDTRILTTKKVEKVFMECLFKVGENQSQFVPGPGIVKNVGFHPERIKQHKAEIAAMLDELPDQFKESVGGGWSFLNACHDKHGLQWTSYHQTMEQLFQLGIAIGKVTCPLPREMWESLPGGVPYYMINTDFKEVEIKAA